MGTIMGLRQRILKAETVGEIEALLLTGKGFRNAAKRTQRAWNNAAKRRTLELRQSKA